MPLPPGVFDSLDLRPSSTCPRPQPEWGRRESRCRDQRVFSQSRPASTPKEKATHQDGGSSFGVVYVNRLAREFVSAAPAVQFPQGAIIVREKLAKADDARPQALAAIKRVRGFNPKANDWEFLMLDGATNKILERQKEGSCVDCHAEQKQRDFVYATPGVDNN